MSRNRKPRQVKTKVTVSKLKRGAKALKKPPVQPSQEDQQDDSILWGRNQQEPVNIVSTVRRSKTASLCVEQIATYTLGNGFEDDIVASTKANKDQTMNDILDDISQPMAMFKGFAINIKYTLTENGAIPKALYCLPFENVRLKTPKEKGGEVEKVLYNPYYGTQEYQTEETIEYYLFDPSKVIQQANEAREKEEEYLGQVLYYGQESEYSRFYPTPYWWTDPTAKGGGKLDMENEYLLTKLLNKELDTGFLQNAILKMVGDPDQPIADHVDRANDGKSYTTVGEEFDDYINQKFAGVDGDALMILWSEVKEQFPEIEEFKSRFNYEKLKDVEATVANRISAMFLVPPILAGIMGSGSISKDDIENVVYLMWSTVRGRQMKIVQTLTKVFSLMPSLRGRSYDIENYNPFPKLEEVPQQIWNELTSEERRSWIKSKTNYIV